MGNGQLELLLSPDHRRSDDRQSLGPRTAAAQKKKKVGKMVELWEGQSKNMVEKDVVERKQGRRNKKKEKPL